MDDGSIRIPTEQTLQGRDVDPEDGSVVIARVSQTLGRLYLQTQIAEDSGATPTGELSDDVRALPMWQLRGMLDEVSRQRHDLDSVARRLVLVDLMIREQASALMNHDPMAAVPVPDHAAEAKKMQIATEAAGYRL